MKFSPRVLDVCNAAGIFNDELLEMLKRAAITSQEGGNRRFHGWLFDVRDDMVVSMRKSEPPTHGEDGGNGTRMYECPQCAGWGCAECGWWGKLRRYL